MQILKNDIQNKKLSEDGYTEFAILSPEIITILSDYYASLKSPYHSGFHPSMLWKDAELKKNISETICNTLQEWVSENFTQHKLLYGNFMVKEPGSESIMKLHQDWSYVNEKEHQSFAIWFPLQDLTEQNGTLSMIPKSHLFQNHDRGPGVHCPFQENEKLIITNYGVPLYLKKGQPVVWEHHLLHYSPPNLSQQSRVAVTAIIVPEATPVYHYYKNASESVTSQYQVETPFYFHYNIVQSPDRYAKLLQKKSSERHTFSSEQLSSVLASKKSYNWMNKLKKIFS